MGLELGLLSKSINTDAFIFSLIACNFPFIFDLKSNRKTNFIVLQLHKQQKNASKQKCNKATNDEESYFIKVRLGKLRNVLRKSATKKIYEPQGKHTTFYLSKKSVFPSRSPFIIS
jgi:hypothetical protein